MLSFGLHLHRAAVLTCKRNPTVSLWAEFQLDQPEQVPWMVRILGDALRGHLAVLLSITPSRLVNDN